MAKTKAVDALADRISEIKQKALLQHTKEDMQSMQISLFDIAPWQDSMRAMPNDYARSALFTVRNKKVAREALQQHLIFHVNKDVEITYTGIELRAEDDELVWQQILEYAKHYPAGTPTSFSMYALCNDLGWPINGRYYQKAEESLTRLQAGAIQFSSTRAGRLESLSLISRFRIVDRSKRSAKCVIELDPEILVLFAGEHYTKFIWEKYRNLKPTARRLFDYLASHRQPYALKLETFRLMCGSDSARPSKWKEQSKIACAELVESGLVKAAWVHQDEILCER